MERSQDECGDAMEHSALPSDAWDCWMNEELQLDAEPPMDISASLWDDLAQSNDPVARSLFACSPLTQIRAASSLRDQDADSPRTSGSWHDPTLTSEGMLQLLSNENPCASPCLLDSFEGHDAAFAGTSEDLPSTPTPLWFMPNDRLSSSPHSGVEQSEESSMLGYFTDAHTAQQGSTPHHANSIDGAIPKCLRTEEHGLPQRNCCGKRGARALSQDFLGSQHCVNAKKFTPLRGKQSSKHTLVRSVSDTQVSETSQKPIVYPFALIKPCSIQGDATLKDINQRISMASMVDSPSGQSSTPPPPTSSPFSGKPILAVTKIHTEGKGTITIMRTRS